jgi:hypothetical protein
MYASLVLAGSLIGRQGRRIIIIMLALCPRALLWGAREEKRCAK